MVESQVCFFVNKKLKIVEHILLVLLQVRGPTATYTWAIGIVMLLGPKVVVIVNEFLRLYQVFCLYEVRVRVR